MSTSLRAIWRPIIMTAGAAVALAGFLPASAHAATAATYRIAVLGDSWASGEGNDPYAAGTGSKTGCHRSLNAWIYQVVLPDKHTVRTDYNNGDASLQFLACQGAATADLFKTYNNEGAQVDRMFSTTTHVFLSISGNDLNFGDILLKCANSSVQDCSAVTTQARDIDIPRAIKNLKSTITKIHAKVPTAEIILTGYAVPVGKDAIPWLDTYWLLKNLAFTFNDDEKTVVSDLANSTINVKFADITSAFAGHEDGTGSSSYFYSWIQSDYYQTRRLHPDVQGETAIAKEASKDVLKPFSCPTLVKKGATGDCVRQIQRSINAWGYSKLTVDGDFGSATYAAVRHFQDVKNLDIDGVVGSATKAILFDK